MDGVQQRGDVDQLMILPKHLNTHTIDNLQIDRHYKLQCDTLEDVEVDVHLPADTT